MDKTKLKYTGNGYRGRDHVTGQEVLCKDGAEVEVSAEKAAQLLKDFPKNFSSAGAAEQKQEDKVTPPEVKPEEKPVQTAKSETGIGYQSPAKPRKPAMRKSGKRK